MENYSKVLVELRAKMNWNQCELANKMGVSQRLISDIENGRTNISKKTAAQIELFLAGINEIGDTPTKKVGINIKDLKMHNLMWRLIELCQKHGTNIVSLSGELGIGDDAVEGWKRGVVLSTNDLNKILGHFGVSEDYLWEIKKPELPNIASVADEYKKRYDESQKALSAAIAATRIPKINEAILQYRNIWGFDEKTMNVVGEIAKMSKRLPRIPDAISAWIKTVPVIDIPRIEVPKIEMPRIELPKAELSNMETRKEDISENGIASPTPPDNKHEQDKKDSQAADAIDGNRLLTLMEAMQATHAQTISAHERAMAQQQQITLTLAEAQRDGLQETNKAIQNTNNAIQETNKTIAKSIGQIAEQLSLFDFTERKKVNSNSNTKNESQKILQLHNNNRP